MVTSIEFWMSLMIKQLITELLNFKPMNILKNIIIGVEAVVWDHNIMTCSVLIGETAYQDGSDGGSIPPSHSLENKKTTKCQQKLNFMGAEKQFESLVQLRNTSKPIKIGLLKI